MYNIAEVYKLINEHHNKTFNRLNLILAMQVIDGSPVEFRDGDNIVATGRIRYQNKVDINSTGNITIPAYITDIVFDIPTLVVMTDNNSIIEKN